MKLVAAVGNWKQIADKLRRMAGTIKIYSDGGEVDRRLRVLQARGLVDDIPSRLQIRFGGMDMLRFCILPAAKDYYRRRGMNIVYHYFLRFLEDPVSMLDPTGFHSAKDTIVGHLLQAVHLNPVYDLQLLQMFDDGLDELESQTRAMVEGHHPRQKTIMATIEEDDYHGKLYQYIQEFRKDALTEPPLRDAEELRKDPNFRLAEATFHTLPAAMRYCARLPNSLTELLVHRFTTQAIQLQYCD